MDIYPENQNKFYVYMLIDPRTDMPFYVGKGCENRYKIHFTPKELKDESIKSRTILKILKLNLQI